MGAVVVVTSNRLPSELYMSGFQSQDYQPFIDLLNERMETVSLKSALDYRLAQLQGIQLLTIRATCKRKI